MPSRNQPLEVLDVMWTKVLTCSRRLFPGNIRVFCRVRPVSQEEQDSADAKTMLSFDSEDDAVLYLSNKGKIMTFELDKVFSPQATQEEVGGSSRQTGSVDMAT